MILRDISIFELTDLSNRLSQNIVIVGDSALSLNKLIYDMSPMSILTNNIHLNRCPSINYRSEYYHFNDLYLCTEIAQGVYLPTAEKAILDAIVWLPENMNEGSLIEALQSYQQMHGDKGKVKLYEVADYYKVPHEFVDYWWKEAEEESDMSMG